MYIQDHRLSFPRPRFVVFRQTEGETEGNVADLDRTETEEREAFAAKAGLGIEK